jgi:hypothetical protein
MSASGLKGIIQNITHEQFGTQICIVLIKVHGVSILVCRGVVDAGLITSSEVFQIFFPTLLDIFN